MLPCLFDKTMEEVKQELDAGNDDIQLLDVREKEEYMQGHIPGAWLLPLQDIEKQAEAIVQQGKRHYVYCRSGQRSRSAIKKLKAMGYQDLYNIGGIVHWSYEQKTGQDR